MKTCEMTLCQLCVSERPVSNAGGNPEGDSAALGRFMSSVNKSRPTRADQLSHRSRYVMSTMAVQTCNVELIRLVVGRAGTFAFALAVPIIALVLPAATTERPGTRFVCSQGRPRDSRGCSACGWLAERTIACAILPAILRPRLLLPWRAKINPIKIHRRWPGGGGSSRRCSQCRLTGKTGLCCSWGRCGCRACTILRASLRLLDGQLSRLLRHFW